MRMRVLIAFLAVLPSLALAAPSDEDKLFADLKKADSPKRPGRSRTKSAASSVLRAAPVSIS